jgi:hypothetical protein
VRITHRQQKEAQPEASMTTSKHDVLLVALVSGRDGCAFRERRLRWIKSNNEKDFFNTIEPERKSRSYSITSVEPTRMYCPAFFGSFGWELQQLISQFVVAGVALCHIF